MGTVKLMTFTVTLRTDSDGAYRRLRRTLKTALRRDQLRAIDIREHSAPKVSRCSTAQAVRRTQARRQEKTTMDMRKYSGPAFRKPDDVRTGSLRFKILDIAEGQYGRPDLAFDDGSKLSLNATNNRTLLNAYGGNSVDWINKEIELNLGDVEYNGQMQETVVVKPVSPPIEKKPLPPKPRKGPGGDMDDTIPF